MGESTQRVLLKGEARERTAMYLITRLRRVHRELGTKGGQEDTSSSATIRQDSYVGCMGLPYFIAGEGGGRQAGILTILPRGLHIKFSTGGVRNIIRRKQ